MTNSSARPRRDGARSLLVMALASVSALALTGPASAQSVDQASRAATAERDFDIPAQALSSALLRFAEQSDLQILFSQEDVAGMTSRPVRGRLTPEAALAQLLPLDAPRIEIAGDRVVRTDLPRPQYAESDEEIVVTGTRIRGAAPAGAHVLTLDADAIEETGRTTLQDVLQTLPQNFPGSQNEASQLGSINAGRNVSFGSTVDLRGLGADATLTLLNGRRLAPAGFGNFVDISAIPLAAVERVDVLADGASAIYGADAVAGVVNIILRDDFEGAETSVRYGAATRGEPTEIGFSQVFGTAWRTGSAMIGYEYRDRSELAADDRWFSATSDLRPWGGTNFSSPFTNPGNITRIGATNVVLAIPEGQDGTSLSAGDLLPGVVNQRPLNAGNSLLPQQTNHGVFATLRQDITPSLDIFVDLIAARREAESDRWQNNATLVVPETNAYRVLNNLFPGQGAIRINYNLGDDLGPSHFSTRADTLSLALGGSYELPYEWRVEASASLSRYETAADQLNIFSPGAALNAALASSDLNTAFNPFGDGANSPAAALVGLTFDDHLEGLSEMVVYGAKLDGPFMRLWGGQARLAIGVERREETLALHRTRVAFTGTTVTTSVPESARTTDAIFAEVFLPLIGPEQNIFAVQGFDISMSLRRESASDFGDATTPKIGATWTINDELALRASWGESFKAPQFQYLRGNIVGTLTFATPAQDPFATNGSTGVLILGGANPGLRPESAENWTAGFDYRPAWASGLRFNATYYDVDFVDRISPPGSILSALVNPVGYETVFIRNPTQAQIDAYLAEANTVVGAMPVDGIEVIWDDRQSNLASLRTRGVDFGGSYSLDTSWGDFNVFAQASLMLQYTVQTGPASTPIDALDTLFYPVDLRARAGVSWNNDGWGAGLTAIYVDDYRDNISTPARDVDEWLTWDAQVSYDWSGQTERAGPQITLNVQNLFDEDPSFTNNPVGYAFDAQAHSPLGRFVSLELRQRW